MKLLITNLQKYSIHDGEGIRTTVFFKGCPLSCTWCHNPETHAFTKQLLFVEVGCTGCGSCIPACPNAAITIANGIAVTDQTVCKPCGYCVEFCLQNIRTLSGTYYSVDELIKEIEKDKVFYEQSGGGVTLSGGEVLAQDMDYIEELVQRLHQKGYRINIDTCGYAPFDKIEKILPYINTFLYDIKLMDPVLHQQFTGVDNKMILDNLKRLSSKKASIWIRIPIIGGINNTVSAIEEIAIFLNDERIFVDRIHLLPYHNTGSDKYKRLQKKYIGVDYTTPKAEDLEQYKVVFQKYGFDQVIIGG